MATETGEVLFFDVRRGYGFILPDAVASLNDRDLNVWFPSVVIVGDGVKKGARVEFERDPRKPGRAALVRTVT